MDPEIKAKLLDGKACAQTIRDELRTKVQTLSDAHEGRVPGLGVIQVGSRPDSSSYVRMKKRAAEEAGMYFEHVVLPEDVSQADLESAIKRLNVDDRVDGFLVQLPLSDHLNEREALDLVDLNKDVDGFHPQHIGDLALRGRTPKFVPCTPRGCIELLQRENIQIEGKNAVVIGRSNIVGIPLSLLLLNANATVTVCHSRTSEADLIEKLKHADLVFAAVGKPEMVRGEWLKPGAVVVDVGINAVDDASRKRGYRLVGDVHFNECAQVVSRITPVPGGVGPMTVAMLVKATVESAERRWGK